MIAGFGKPSVVCHMATSIKVPLSVKVSGASGSCPCLLTKYTRLSSDSLAKDPWQQTFTSSFGLKAIAGYRLPPFRGSYGD